HIRTLSTLDDVALETADLPQAVEVLVHRPPLVGIERARVEMRGVHYLVGNREHALDHERMAERQRVHARDDVDSLEHHRPPLLERAVDRRANAREHVARLLEEAE